MMNEEQNRIEEVRKKYSELNDEQRQLVDKVLKMLGEKIEDIDKIMIGTDGGILLESGKPNMKKFVKMAMEMD